MAAIDLYEAASPETRKLVDVLLEQDAVDRQWAAQVGPSLTQTDAARLLGKSEQATAKDARLLRVRTRSGRVAYPIVQFSGRGPLDGLPPVLKALAPVADPLTILAWLTGTQPTLDRCRPIDALHQGDDEAVLTLARQFAREAA